MARPDVRLQVIGKPEFVIKGNPNDIVVIPIEIKNVGSSKIPEGCFIGMKDRNAKLTNFVVDDARINLPADGKSTFFANTTVRFMRPNGEHKNEKLILCVFGPNGISVSDSIEIEVGYMPIPEPLFLEQAQEMASMGLNFDDCVKSLKRFGGNLEQAIDHLLNQL